MQAYESNGKTDYIYYPIEFPTKTLTAVATINKIPSANFSTWMSLIDKCKFIAGKGTDYSPGIIGSKNFNTVFIGF